MRRQESGAGGEDSGLMSELCIVTGGAGFIGSHLVKLLVDSGRRVRVVERPGADVKHLAPEVEVVFADIRDRARSRPPCRAGRGSIIWRPIPISGHEIGTNSRRSTIVGP